MAWQDVATDALSSALSNRIVDKLSPDTIDWNARRMGESEQQVPKGRLDRAQPEVGVLSADDLAPLSFDHSSLQTLPALVAHGSGSETATYGDNVVEAILGTPEQFSLGAMRGMEGPLLAANGFSPRRDYVYRTSLDWDKNLTNALSDRIVDAICKARTPGARIPTFTEGMVFAQDIAADLSQETISNQNKYRTFQAVFNQEFIKSGSDWFGYIPVDQHLLPEVTYRLDESGNMTTPVLSLTRTNEYGNAGPGSIQRGLQVGREVGRGNTVRWDMTVVKDPSKPLTWSNVSDIFEFKFPGDGMTPNQGDYAQTSEVASKLRIIYTEDFANICDRIEQDRRRAVNDPVRQSAEAFKSMLPFIGRRSGARLGN